MNVQMCKCADVQIKEKNDFFLQFAHLHICTSAHQNLYLATNPCALPVNGVMLMCGFLNILRL